MQGAPPERLTVGVLSPGEMGTAVGNLLLEDGIRVVTTLSGRGARTRASCGNARFLVLDDLAAVAREASVVFSLVPPAAALSLAATYASIPVAAGATRIYVDLNSIAPETATAIDRRLSQAGIAFVDGAINGPANRLRDRCRVFLSGAAAGQVAPLFHALPFVRVLGATPGLASTCRLLMSGLTKGVIAVFLEASVAARNAGLLDELLNCYRESYPGVMELVERSLPTFPRHARRRADEMNELARTLLRLHVHPDLAAAAGKMFFEMGTIDMMNDSRGPGPVDWSVQELVEGLAARRFLSVSNPEESA